MFNKFKIISKNKLFSKFLQMLINSPINMFLQILMFFILSIFSFFFKNKIKEITNLDGKIEHAKIVFSKNSVFDLYLNILNEKNILYLDKFFLYLISNQYKNIFFENFRINFRLNFFKNGFYALYSNPKSIKLNFFEKLNFFLSGWVSFFNFFSKWFLPLLLLLTFVYYSLIIKSLPFNKVLFVWTALFMTFYWIVSGFVFFFKKYQYGKFTSVIQRFWKRTLILFWLIEGGLLLVFIFLTINSSVYLYNVVNQMQIFQTHLFSWRIFLLKLIPTTILLLLTYLFLLNNKWQPLNKNVFLLTLLTFLLLYITWIEFYQFFHVMSYYNNLFWSYDLIDKFWVVKPDTRKTSQTNHLVSLLLILKFWHVLFVLAVWLFFVLRSEESDRIRYPLIAANFLNFVMLYLLTWVYMYPWFKWFFRRYFSYSYKWFYQNNRSLGYRLFYNDLRILFLSISESNFNLKNYYILNTFKNSIFFSWKNSNHLNNFSDFNKKFVYSQILQDFFHTNFFEKKNIEFFKYLINLSNQLGYSIIHYYG